MIFSELTKLINKPFYRSKPSPTDDKEIKNKRRLHLRMSFSQPTISSLSLFITLPQDGEGPGSTTERRELSSTASSAVKRCHKVRVMRI